MHNFQSVIIDGPYVTVIGGNAGAEQRAHFEADDLPELIGALTLALEERHRRLEEDAADAAAEAEYENNAEQMRERMISDWAERTHGEY